MGKGSNTTTNTSTSSADPQAAAAYRDILARAQGVASTPYQAYTGELTAPINSQQQAGIAGINSNANYASPYISQAAGIAGNAANPLTQQQIQSYLNPYTQNVVDATNAQMQHDNGVQMAQLQGNQIAQGALGGNATGVAKGILAGQNARTMASTDANLYSQGYGQALQTAYQQYQQNPMAAGNAIANYGVAGQNAALTGANAQLGAGTLLQQSQQAADTANYGQYAQAQAYPYQQTQWLAGLATGVGSNLGGTSYGSTTGPAPNQTAQYLGLGLSAAGLFAARGGAIRSRAFGGGVAGYADGGVPSTPWANGVGWIPQMNIHSGSGAPHASAPGVASNPGGNFDASKLISGINGLGGGEDWRHDWSGAGSAIGSGVGLSGDAWGGGSFMGGDAYGGSSTHPVAGLSADDYGFARGGVVGINGYAGGGVPVIDDPSQPVAMFGEGEELPVGASFEERSRPARDAIAKGDFDPHGINSTTFEGTPGMVASNTGVVPMPRSRPEEAVGAPVVAEDDEEDAAPVGVAGRTGVAGKPPVMASDAPANPYYAAPDAVSPPKRSSFGLGLLSPNAKTGLLAAGLGMLASRSPFLGNAVGEGGIAGLSAYGNAEEHDRKVAAEAAKLSAEAREKAANFGLNVRKQGEVERHNLASEKNARATADRTKFVPAGQYMGEDGIYRPVVMDQSSGRLVDPATGAPPPTGAKIQGKGDVGFTDDEAKDIARRYVVSGDITDMQGIGPAARLKVSRAIKQVQKDLGVSDEELAQRKVEFAGRKAGSRTLGTMEAKMGSAAFEAEGAIKLVRGVIEKLPRTSFLPFNQLMEGYSKKTLNPDQAELAARAQAIVNTYSAVMSRGANVVTDSARHHAAELLNTAYDPTTFNRMLDTILSEIEMAKGSPARMQEFYRQHYGPKSVEAGTGSAGAPPVATAPAGGLVEGRTGIKGGRPVVVKGGRLIYSDTGEPAQ